MTSKLLSLVRSEGSLTANKVLEAAKDQYKTVLVIGYDNDGVMDVRSTLDLNHADILWMIESFKNGLLNGNYDGS